MTTHKPETDNLSVCNKEVLHVTFADSLRADISEMIIEGINTIAVDYNDYDKTITLLSDHIKAALKNSPRLASLNDSGFFDHINRIFDHEKLKEQLESEGFEQRIGSNADKKSKTDFFAELTMEAFEDVLVLNKDPVDHAVYNHHLNQGISVTTGVHTIIPRHNIYIG